MTLARTLDFIYFPSETWLPLSPKIRMELVKVASLERPNFRGEGEPILYLCKSSFFKVSAIGQ